MLKIFVASYTTNICGGIIIYKVLKAYPFYKDIVKALSGHTKLEDVMELFSAVQKLTHCSTGCGGCHDKVLDLISEIMMG